MSPCQLLLELVGFLLLLAGLGGLLEADGGMAKGGAEVGEGFFLVCEDFEGFFDVVEAGVVFVGELGELGAAEEELEWGWLGGLLMRKEEGGAYLVFVGWRGGAEDLAGGIWKGGELGGNGKTAG